MRDHLHSMWFAGIALVVAAFLCGAGSLLIWQSSNAAWETYIADARGKGALLYDALVFGAPLPGGMTSSALTPADHDLADQGRFERISGVPRPALVTNITIRLTTDALTGSTVQFALVSPDLRYPVSELRLGRDHDPRGMVGEVVALLARYCGQAELFAKTAGAPWQLVSGPGVWQCTNTPPDYRLLAVLCAVIGLLAASSIVVSNAQHIPQFAQTLRAQRNLNGMTSLPLRGPTELREVIEAFNAYRDMERAHLAERASVLSGVSHDLGTPATRLKLRTPLIGDPELRQKFERDIDQMTGIIESVLAYTRSELSTEEPRHLSLRSLVEAIVADYEDTGRPVIIAASDHIILEGGQSIFMSRRGQSTFKEDPKIVIQGRPIALRRAISNLIDNALNYGRRATVSIETDAKEVHVLIEDEGGPSGALDLNALLAPFERGPNASSTPGFGMGLTIASTIAVEHGGALSFEQGKSGNIARLSLAR